MSPWTPRRPSKKSVFSAVLLPRLGVQSPNNPESVSLILFDFRACNYLHHPEGSTVAVFGCGAIGLGAIATSQQVGASRIIAVDTNPNKESLAREFGATDFINSGKLPQGKKIQEYLVEITDGGLDYTFDCTGNVSFHYNIAMSLTSISL